MEFFGKYIINFLGLQNHKEYFFDFNVGDDFFTDNKHANISGANVNVAVILVKSKEGLVMDIKVSGFLSVTCSRCLDNYSQKILFRDTIVANFDEETNFDSDNTVSLSSKADKINISQFIYEFCDFALPICCAHPVDVHGNSDCNKAMLEIIEKHKVNENKIDPRWEQLKQFIN